MARRTQAERFADLEVLRNHLRHSADTIRNRGHTREQALCLAADFYGLTIARMRKLVFGISLVVTPEEEAAMCSKYLQLLREDAENLSARAAASRSRLARLEAGERIDYAREPGTEHIPLTRGNKRGPQQRTIDKLVANRKRALDIL